MKKKIYIAALLAIVVALSSLFVFKMSKNQPKQEVVPVTVEQPEQRVVEKTSIELNNDRFDALIDNIVTVVAYFSGFNEQTFVTGNRFAFGFNNTVVGNRLVKDGQKTTKKEAYAVTVDYLNNHVRPFLVYINRTLSDHELIALSSFIYSVGGEAFTGYSEDNEPIKKPSRLLEAINNNEEPMVCARYFTGFRNKGGVIKEGLLKLRWLQAALYSNVVSVTDLENANVVGIFGMKVPCLFEHGYPDKDGYYTPKFTPNTVTNVLKQRGNRIKTKDLLKF